MKLPRDSVSFGVAACLAFLSLAMAPALSGCGGDHPVTEEEQESSSATAAVKLHEGLPKAGGRCNTRCNDKRPTAEQRRERAQCMKPVWDEIRKARAELAGRPPNEVKDALRKIQQDHNETVETCNAPLKSWLACMDECRDETPAKP